MKHMLAAALMGAAILAAPALAQKPQYGGNLEIGTVSLTISALSWDPADFAWKLNHDTGLYLETLFAGDLDKSIRKGGKYSFKPDAWLASDALRGELAETWEWTENPLTLVIKLRKGIMWPEKAGVMKSREFVADDVVFSFNRQNTSPKRFPDYYDYVTKVEATDKHTVVFHMKYYNSDWDYRFGWGYYSQIIPKELADAGAGNWKNAVGTGPFQLTEYVQGNAQGYTKNPLYWDKEKIDGQEYKIPFVDKVTYRIIKDEATQHAALRTGKLDVLEWVRWQAVDQLKKSAPQLQWSKWLSYSGIFLAMRTDRKPFDDIRVRKALNMAVNKQEIVKDYYAGNAELFAYPQHPDYIGFYEPLESMPPEIKELYVYDPVKAKKLLAEAGYPKGFTFKAQVCSCSPENMDLLPLVAGYLEQIGVKVEIQPMEYGAFLSAMTTATHAEGYFMANGHTNPTRTLHKSFTPGQLWGPSMLFTPEFTAKMDKAYGTRDLAEQQKLVRELTREIVGKAPYIWLPIPYYYTAWWPWVKNYDGELRVGAVKPGPIYARMWIDQEMKKKMGY
ncbi:MAG: ABC transporter substrate-binding protein [Alphaproteobacteria bacterium]|nr:ABC transporter substrate-binding protein [Alphaproteobacteria bacterium]